MSRPTAAINSHMKMRVEELAAGLPWTCASRPTACKERREPSGWSVIQAFVMMGGNMLTMTVTDVEEPETYRHLRLRMSGWSAYSVMLGIEQQLLHIRRVEHGLV